MLNPKNFIKLIVTQLKPLISMGIQWWIVWMFVYCLYLQWFHLLTPFTWIAFFIHSLIFLNWFFTLVFCLELIRNYCSDRPLILKGIYPLIFLLFLLIWIVPLTASWIGFANWGMVITSDIIGVFISYFNEMRQISIVNSTPILILIILFLIAFCCYHFFRAEHLSKVIFPLSKNKILSQYINRILFLAILLSPLFIFDFTREKTIKIIKGSDPITSFLYANAKEKYFRIKSSQNKITDPNIGDSISINLNAPNVIIICLDALRQDRLSAYSNKKSSMSFLDSLIMSGFFQKIEQPYTNATSTVAAIYALLYSNYFIGGTTPRDRPSLAWLLHKAGYRNHFLLSGIHRAWYGLGNFYTNDADFYFEGMDSDHYGPNDDKILFEGLNKIKDYNGSPNFFYIHSMSSHVVGTKWQGYNKNQPDTYNIWEANTESQIQVYSNHYQNGVEQADLVVKLLLEELNKKGYLNHAIIWILADHGESLAEHDGLLGHAEKPWDEVIKIPMLMHNPDSSKLDLAIVAQLQDIAPTTIQMLGLPIPHKWNGRSILDHTAIRSFRIQGNESECQLLHDSIGVKEKYVLHYKDSLAFYYNLRVDSLMNLKLSPKHKPSWIQ